MAEFDVTIPDQLVQQVLPALQAMLAKIGGTIQPDTDDAAMKGQRQAQIGARANRPSNLVPPVPVGPAPMAPGMPGQ